MKRILTIVLSLALVFAFTSTAFAVYWNTKGSWSSSVCMYAFTANATLTKDADDEWDHFTPIPDYVRYDNATNYGYMNAYVMNTSGTRMSDTCSNSAHEEDDVYIYAAADAYNTLRVRIENAQYPGQHNMRSAGTFYANYDS